MPPFYLAYFCKYHFIFSYKYCFSPACPLHEVFLAWKTSQDLLFLAPKITFFLSYSNSFPPSSFTIASFLLENWTQTPGNSHFIKSWCKRSHHQSKYRNPCTKGQRWNFLLWNIMGPLWHLGKGTRKLERGHERTSACPVHTVNANTGEGDLLLSFACDWSVSWLVEYSVNWESPGQIGMSWFSYLPHCCLRFSLSHSPPSLSPRSFENSHWSLFLPDSCSKQIFRDLGLAHPSGRALLCIK